jgi:hypothetical protein
VELDATVRGAPGTPPGDANRRLAWTMWVAERVGRRETMAAPATASAARGTLAGG